jgi:hypothetical protein
MPTINHELVQSLAQAPEQIIGDNSTTLSEHNTEAIFVANIVENYEDANSTHDNEQLNSDNEQHFENEQHNYVNHNINTPSIVNETQEEEEIMVNGNVMVAKDNNTNIPNVVRQDLKNLDPNWADLIEAEIKQVENEGEFEVVMSKSQKRKHKKKLDDNFDYSTRPRAGRKGLDQ